MKEGVRQERGVYPFNKDPNRTMSDPQRRQAKR